MLPGLKCHVDTSDLAIVYVDLVDPSICENGEIWPANLAVDDIVEVSSTLSDRSTALWTKGYIRHTGRASATILRVISHGEEPDALLKLARCSDFRIEVVMYRNVHGIRTGLDPVQAQLISMILMHWLNSVFELHDHALEHVKRPAFTAVHILPPLSIEAEWVKRD